MVEIQNALLMFLDEDESSDNIQYLTKLFEDTKIYDHKHDIKSLFILILKISNNHHRAHNFFYKIEKILLLFKNAIKLYFTNYEIFNIFKSNKRILLFLLEEKVIHVSKSIEFTIKSAKYLNADYQDYFCLDNETQTSKNVIENFEEKRKIGENAEYICELIRKDSIDEFIGYSNQVIFPLDQSIQKSIFETNSFLNKRKNTTIIEYAAFFGSIQIFKYLLMNHVELESSLWLYAIHGGNAELIHILEENHVEPPNDSYEKCIKESIKSHHNEIANYILNNYIQNEDEISYEIFKQCLKSYNFEMIQEEYINKLAFYYLCQNGYFSLVETFLQNDDIDINKENIDQIFNRYLLMEFKIVFKKTAFHIAIENGHLDIVKLLLTNNKLNLNIISI